MIKRMFLVLGVFLAVVSISVFAAIPRTICYQGKLLNKANNLPIIDSREITFTIYNSSDGSSLWSQKLTVTPDSNGSFGEILGPIPASVDFSAGYEVGINIGGEELSPRQKLTAAPYALRALVADSVAGGGSKASGMGIMSSGSADYAALSGTSTNCEKGHAYLIQDGLRVGTNEVWTANGYVGIGTSTPDAKLVVAGQLKITGGAPGAGKFLKSIDGNGLTSWETITLAGTAIKTVSINNAYIVKPTDSIILCTTNSFNVTLPSAVDCSNKMFTIKRAYGNSAPSMIYVLSVKGQTIDGMTSYLLSSEGSFVTIVSDGANWQIVSY